MKLLKRPRVRRYGQNFKILAEIRRAQKCVEMVTPKLPFRRLVREICENWDLLVRWKLTGLLTLQEAAEDFLIEYFNDLCLLAAHSHRVTIMNRDSDTLKRVRWRYDKLLHPTDFIDPKMRDILLIPAYRKPKSTVKIVDITHEVNTRLKAEQDERIKAEHSQRKREERAKANKEESMKEYLRETADVYIENLQYLRAIRNGLQVVIPLGDGHRQLSLDMADINILMDRTAHISDSILYVALK